MLKCLDKLLFASVVCFVFSYFVSSSYAGQLNVSGWMGVDYRWSEDQSVSDSFGVRYAWMNFIGELQDGFSYVLGFDAAAGSNIMRDASIKYKGLPYGINATAGQFVAPFSYAVLTAPPKWPTIELAVNALLVPIYDRGLMIDSSLLDNKLYYALAVINGTGGNAADDNKSKDVVGRVLYSPLKDLSFGLSAQTGRQTLTGSYEGERTRYDVLFIYEPGVFRLIGEYVFQNSERTAGLSNEYSHCWYVTAIYPFFQKLDGVLQYSQYDPDQSASGDKQDAATLGCNYHFNENYTLQANFRHLIEEPGGDQLNNNQFLLHLIVSF